MTSILVHLGCTGPYISGTTPPPCLEHCIDQYKLFNADDLYVITDSCNVPLVPKRERVFAVAAEDYRSDKVDELVRLWPYSERDFWTVSLTRFVYIENFMRANNVMDVFHFENDVMVYSNLVSLRPVMRKFPIWITVGGEKICMTGMMYICDFSYLDGMTWFFVNTLRKGCDYVKRAFDLYAIEEMQMLWAFSRSHTDCMGFLPILPYGQHSYHFDEFRSVFDPATYGQYVGGTRTDGPGVKVPNHYIGQEFLKHPGHGVVWEDQDGLRVPYFQWDEGLVKINNLHIHSKNLHLYRSVG